MSEIRVNRITSNRDKITFTGITTFSGTGCVSLPGGKIEDKSINTPEGSLRYIDGDISKGVEYFNGYHWLPFGTLSVNGPDGIIPIGIFGGGLSVVPATTVNVLDFIQISSIGYNAVDFGDLSANKRRVSACSSTSRGLFGGGTTPTNTSIIEYITFATSGNSITFGNLTALKHESGTCSSNIRGIWGGGYQSAPSTPTGRINTIEYVTIPTTGNAQSFGILTRSTSLLAACSSNTRGIFAGGFNAPASALSSVIEYITIATTGNSLSFGTFTTSRGAFSGSSSATRGVFGGGQTPTNTSNIFYITISTLGDGVSFGSLLAVKTDTASCSSSTRGIWAGGFSPATPTIVNVIEHITIASTGNSEDFADLTGNKSGVCGTSNNHGGLCNV